MTACLSSPRAEPGEVMTGEDAVAARPIASASDWTLFDELLDGHLHVEHRSSIETILCFRLWQHAIEKMRRTMERNHAVCRKSPTGAQIDHLFHSLVEWDVFRAEQPRAPRGSPGAAPREPRGAESD